MKDQNKCVIGIYRSRPQAEDAVRALETGGFAVGDISLLLPDSTGTHELAHSKATKAPEGALAGGSSGAVIGGTLGVLIGIGALAIPGVGPLIAAGPIMAGLAGLGAGGALGGLAGALVGLGMPEFEAKQYEGYVKNGGILLSVHAGDSDRVTRAREILERTGARDIATTHEIHEKLESKDRIPPSDVVRPMTGVATSETDLHLDRDRLREDVREDTVKKYTA